MSDFLMDTGGRRWLGRIAMILEAVTSRPSRDEGVRLHVDELSDHVLRDIGLMDGRGPSLRRPDRRGS